MADIFDIALGKALDAAVPTGTTGSDSGIFDALINQESGGKQFDKKGAPLTSKAGAVGIAQVMPATAPEAAKLAGLEYDEMRYRNDPEYNKALGRAYFNKQLNDFGGDTSLALAAYNAGPGRVRTALAQAEKAGTPDAWLRFMPQETQQYVPSIMRRSGAPAPRTGEFVTPTGQEYVGPAKARESSTIGDFGKELAASFIQGVGSIAQLPGEVGAAVMNRVTGTEDYESKNVLAPVAEAIRGTMTEGGRQAREGAEVKGSVVDLVTGQAEVPDNLDSWLMMGANGFGSLLTTVLPLVGPTRRIAALTEAAKAAEAAGDVAKAAELVRAAQSAAARSKAIGAGTGAGITGGAAAEEVRQTAEQAVGRMSHEDLLQNVPAYAQVFQQTGNENQARQAVVNSAARWAGGLASVAGGVGGVINARLFEDFLVKKGVSTLVGNSAASRAGRGAIAGAGGSLAEAGQETTEKVGQNVGENIGLGRAPTQDALRNTAGDALGGAIVGGPVGFGGGVMSTPTPAAPVVPPALQPVAAKAAEGNSPLSKAAMAGATAQTAAQPAAPAADPISARVGEIEAGLRTDGTLESIRGMGRQMGNPEMAGEFLYALQVARDPNTPPDLRQKALADVEQALEWTKTGFTTPTPEAPKAPGTDLAVRQQGAVGPVGQAQFFDPNVVDVEATRVDNMLPGPRALPGPTAEVEQAQPAADAVSPEEQQTVAEPTKTVKNPAAQTTPAGTGPAATRRRAETLGQLVGNGFETVERRGNEFFLKNSGTGQEFKLDGMADAQIARNLINKTFEAKANEAAASPTNDLKATDAMKAAGNIKNASYELNGFKLKIAFPKGSERAGTSPDGEMWKRTMTADYGDIEGIRGADGDKMDVFVGPRRDTNKIFVVDQVKEDGSFDEHKVVMGAASEDQARQVYLSNYPQGWNGLGAITAMTPEQFRAWAKSPAAKKPAATMQPKAAPAATQGAAQAQGRFATLDEAKAFISAQRQSGGSVSGLPLRLTDGSYTVAAKGTPQYAEAQRQRDAEQTETQGEFFTVPDAGKQKRLKKVKKGSLPKNSTVRRKGRSVHRTLSEQDATLIEQIASILGKEVVFFESPDGRLSDGFVMPGEPNTIYVATETSVNPLSVFGHEFFHTLRETNPQAWNAIAAVVKAKSGQEAFDRMQALGYSKDAALEEFISDLGGDLLRDPTFWRDVFARIQKDHGKDAKGIIARLAAAIEHMIGKLVAGIRQNGYGADEFVSDMDAVRDAFASAMSGYLRNAGVSKSAMDSEIKKSVIRVSAEQQALQEYAEVEAQYRNTDQWMKAPNGEPSKLSERQWVQVRTPSFKAWFGDWEKFATMKGGVWNDGAGEVSKVVDENGEPLVVYHGTSEGGFSIFKQPRGERRGDLGIFTTPNREMAKTYVTRGRAKEIEFDNMDDEPLLVGDNVEKQSGYYASFVNIRNPLESDFEGAYWNGERPGQYVVVDEDGEQLSDRDGKMYFESEAEAEEVAAQHGEAEVQPALDHYETTDSVVREARESKNDGAIIRSVVDSGSGFSGYIDEPSDVFVALHPSQLKSATQNTGEFGRNSNDMRFSVDRPSDVDPNGYNEFTATPEDIAQADAFEAENGIRPYTSAGQLQVPVKIPSIKKSVKREGKYGNHPILGIPVNANGTVTLYYPTTNDDARRIVRERSLRGVPGADRVYLTNESGVANVMAKMGNIEQEVDGANVLVQINPELLHIDTEYEDGRKDFFIPIQEGGAFKGRMSQVKLFTQNAPRTKGLSKDTTIRQITDAMTRAVNAFKDMSFMERRAELKRAKQVLKDEHNVGTLLSVNGKLEKTNVGGYGLNNYDGKDVMSMGLGLASAQKINDIQKLTTCPQSAICESLCLGETSGQNLLYGGDGQFRSGPRMSQYLKTEAMVQHPEEFAVKLASEIELFRKNAAKEDYQATVRLNVTSDFNPDVFEALIKAFPEVMFYDYTKLNTLSISPNHHLTYSSTGASQVVGGKLVFNPFSNWNAMVKKLNRGLNVAMAFTDRNDMPSFVVDGKTGQRFGVWNGDNYDARFLDPKRPDGIGWIVGLTNKDRTTKPEMAAEAHRGFFLDYLKSRDGDTVVIPDQDALAAQAEEGKASKVIQIVPKFSRDREMAPVRSVERPVFFSQLQRAIGEVPQRLATMAAPQWKQWLKANAPKLGIKAEEIQWSGIENFLDLKGKEKLSKDDLVAFLDDSGVRVEEVVKGKVDVGERFRAVRFADLTEDEKQEVPGYSYAEDGDWVVYFDGEAKGAYDTVSGQQAIDMVAEDIGEYFLEEDETKFEKYSLPGGTNYREVLLTLPSKFVPKLQFKVGDEVETTFGTKAVIVEANPEAKGKPYTIRSASGMGYLYQTQIKGGTDPIKDPSYTSSHWNEANVIAHLRVNDRIVDQGQRVLFVEEIQSDWAQQGRKQGFGGLTEAEQEELVSLEEQEDRYGVTGEDAERLEDLREKAEDPIPMAPFVSKVGTDGAIRSNTEAWVDLVLKRVAMMAVEGGYDAVAFVNGTQSAERYQMSKYIDSVKLETAKDRYLLTATRDGAVVMSENLGSRKKVADYVGKELADRLLEKLKNAPFDTGIRSAELSGLDMKVGGEGMVKFYDEIVPQRVSKLLPKIKGGALQTYPIKTDRYKGFVRYEVGTSAIGNPAVVGVKANGERIVLDQNGDIREKVDQLNRDMNGSDQMGFPVTDEMRNVVSQGLPLFSRDRPAADKPLTESKFYREYMAHKDLQGKAAGNAEEVAAQIAETGFRRGRNVNLLPAYRGGQPTNVMERGYAPMKGDTVYLIPKEGRESTGNGDVIKAGYRPKPYEVLRIDSDYPSLYQEYLKAWKDWSDNKSSAAESYNQRIQALKDLISCLKK